MEHLKMNLPQEDFLGRKKADSVVDEGGGEFRQGEFTCKGVNTR